MVRGKKMKNPLRKRLPRELKTEFGKYLVIFLLLVATIGLVSGFLVADGSMIIAYNEGFEKYNVENGNFLLEKRANKAQIKAIEAAGVTLYENFYTEEALTNESTMRYFQNRQEVNTVCLMKGELPAQADEDRDRPYVCGQQQSGDRGYAQECGREIQLEDHRLCGPCRITVACFSLIITIRCLMLSSLVSVSWHRKVIRHWKRKSKITAISGNTRKNLRMNCRKKRWQKI